MKPMYACKVRVRRCRCCVSVYAKVNNGGSRKSGNTAARQDAKKAIRFQAD